jgi:photosystem II stability/assembly factor-like uncharacterized protein
MFRHLSRPLALFGILVMMAGIYSAVGDIDSQIARGMGESKAFLTRKAGFRDKKSKETYSEAAEAHEYFYLKRSPDGHTPVSPELYIRAIRQAELMPQYSSSRNRFYPPQKEMAGKQIEAAELGSWTHLGPGNIGGRTRALLIDPANPDIMYSGGVAGGVWKTTNAGASWIPLSDLLPNLAVCSLAFDPEDSRIIYAGTGEGVFNGDMVRGAGIFKSIDAGATWSFLQTTSTDDFHYVNKIVPSPNNRNRIYAGTRTGVWRSDDGGANWNRVLNPLDSDSDTVRGGCLDLAIRSDLATDYIFASCGTLEQSTVYRNIDAGGAGQWEPVLREQGMGRTTIAIAPSNQNIVYALAASSVSGDTLHRLHAVYRSTNGGADGSWNARVRGNSPTKLNTVLLTNPIIAHQSECGGGSNGFFHQGWYDNIIAVDPVNPDRVWAGGIDLFRSDDGGSNWGLASYWWINPRQPQYAHADQHLIVFHPQYDGISNRVMFAANDGGVFRTDDATAQTARGASAPCSRGNTRVRWTSLNTNYGVTQFYHGLPYPGGTTYLGGTQDNGTLRGTDADGTDGWDEIFGGDGGYVAIDPTNTRRLFVETINLSIRRSLDGGETFQAATSGISDTGFLFITPFIMAPGTPQHLWTGGRSLWRTNDFGSNWTRASQPLTGNSSVSALAVAQTNSNFALAGTNSGSIHRNTNALAANGNTIWTGVQPRNGFVSSLAFDPADEAVAYATYSTFGGAHVWRSNDAGASWTPIDGTGETAIPDVPVHSIVVDRLDSQRLYVGTDIGVFVTIDGGTSWARENTGFANVITEALSIGNLGANNALFAFTHGRGVWRVELGEADLRILSVVISGKNLLIYGQKFDSGAQILLNGNPEKTTADSQNPTTNLSGKKVGKKILAGQPVALRVRNSDGILSPQFIFTRP